MWQDPENNWTKWRHFLMHRWCTGAPGMKQVCCEPSVEVGWRHRLDMGEEICFLLTMLVPTADWMALTGETNPNGSSTFAISNSRYPLKNISSSTIFTSIVRKSKGLAAHWHKLPMVHSCLCLRGRLLLDEKFVPTDFSNKYFAPFLGLQNWIEVAAARLLETSREILI